MTTDEKNKFKSKMEVELLEIEQKLSELRCDLLQVADVQPTVLQNGLDHAKELTDLNTRLTLNERHLIRRDQVRAALRRIATGHFGICCECGEDINPKRLEVSPSAAFCIECQSTSGAHRARIREEPDLWITDYDMMRFWLRAA